jgi:hypothetical protein
MPRRRRPLPSTRRDRTRALCSSQVRLAAAAAAEGTPPPPEGTRAVEILAYTGDVVDVGFGPEVFDLAGMEIPTQKHPLLVDHDTARPAGFSTAVEKSDVDLRVRGLVFTDEEDGARVAKRSDKGFPQQASVRVTVLEDELVPAGETRVINGRTLTGPFTHDKRTRLKETSFVALGADANTRAVALTGKEKTQMATKKRKQAAEEMPEVEEEEEVLDEEETPPTDPMAAERARVDAIMEAIPDAKLARQHIKSGSSVEAAKAAYADQLATAKGELETQLADAKAQLAKARKASAPSPNLVPSRRPAAAELEGDEDDREAGDRTAGPAMGVARAKFRAEVRKAIASGLTRQAATRQVVMEQPELHREVLAEANPGRPEPAYRRK